MAATTRVLRLPCKRRSANFVPIVSFSSSDKKPSSFDYLKDIRKKLADRPSLSPPPHSPPPLSSAPESFRELYNRSFDPNGLESRPHAPKPATKELPFDAITKGLKQIRESNGSLWKKNISPPLSALKDNFRLRPGDLSTQEPPVAAGSHFPSSIVPNDINDLKGGNHRGAVEALSVSVYDDKVVGEKLRSLRPDHKGKKNWFSLQELNDRLFKVKEILREASNSRYGPIADLRNALTSIKISTDAKDQSRQSPRLDILRALGGKSDYLAHPPKEHLVEKYFDPALMSSAEKMKLELKKVRDEFKMSESDCGSARVQVAQLTTKIKHLSSVLHKKDKHSRKGLQEMVQKRKKILKYLRRTDWDSYCLVLSKFGLRDNPDYKS